MFNLLTPAHLDDNFTPLSNELFSIGPITVYLYSFMILLGVLGALFMGIKEGKRLGIKSDYIIDGLIIILPLAIIGARLYYVIFEWERYSGNLGRIFRITEGGLAIHGGFLVAVLAAFIYTRVRKIDIYKVMDLIAPGFLIGQIFGRWGNFFNQEAHGGVVGGLSNGTPILERQEQYEFLSNTLRIPDFIVNNMYISSDMASGMHYHHPTFLYESLWNILGLIIVLILRRVKITRSGDLIAFYLIWYSVGRFFIEFMRTDALYVGGTGLRAAQIIGIIMSIVGVIVLIANRFIRPRKRYVDVLDRNDVE